MRSERDRGHLTAVGGGLSGTVQPASDPIPTWDAIDSGWDELAASLAAFERQENVAPSSWVSGDLLCGALFTTPTVEDRTAPSRRAKRVARVAASDSGEATLVEEKLVVAAPRRRRPSSGTKRRR